MQGPRFSQAQVTCVAESLFCIYDAWFFCCAGMHSSWCHVSTKSNGIDWEIQWCAKLDSSDIKQ